jgi:MYXO-CTERM domain-containing protein
MKLDQKLIAYAAAAAASGLALTDAAEAGIVASPGFTFGSGSATNINFDNSGNEEYVLGHGTGPNRVQLLKDDQTIDTNAYVRDPANTNPAALPFGTTIGPGSTFLDTYDATLADQAVGDGNFSVDSVDGNPEYVGVRFQLIPGGPEYFGWIGVDITNSSNLSGRVTGFAYEDTGGSIDAGVVPEPVGLALLALGAPFLLRRRTA